jgi:serine/threonine protein phosphatase 1
MAAPHLELDLTGVRRLLIGGDVHGHLARLIDALNRVGYDPAQGDRLILLGDLLDRGPEVLAIHRWLLANPDVIPLVGNHDDMLLGTLGLRPMDRWNNPRNLDYNGGEWLFDYATGMEEGEGRGALTQRLRRWALHHGGVPPFIDPRIVEFARRMTLSPVAITAMTPGGRRIGLVHADVPTPTWRQLVQALESTDEDVARSARIRATWDRTLFERMEAVMPQGKAALAAMDIGVPDVDHVFMGHSIVPEPMTAGNLTWIDTGPYRGGPITVMDVDAWMDGL